MIIIQSFSDSTKHSELSTIAKSIITNLSQVKYLNTKCIPIIVDDPYLAYALISNLFSPSVTSNGLINNSAHISNEASIGKNVQINANVVINKKCVIKDNVIINENTVIGPDVVIGQKTKIMSNCFVSNSIVGEKCIIQPNVVIGSKGFGFTPIQKIEIKHIGNVIIGNNVDIG